jgi:hypothetical protein
VIDDAGRYVDTPTARPVRIYTRLDVRLMFEDFYIKLAMQARQQPAAESARLVRAATDARKTKAVDRGEELMRQYSVA